MDATFKVTFRGTLPEQVNIGDKLRVEGTVFVNWLGGELVDITSVGAGREYALSDVFIDAVGEQVAVEKVTVEKQ